MATRLVVPSLVVVAFLPWLALYGDPPPACPTDPIAFSRLTAVAAAAAPPPAEPIVPVGVRPASADEQAALRERVEAFLACGDAGEPLRVYALYTERYLGELLYRQGRVTEEQYRDLADPRPADEDERSRLIAVEDVEVLADGRVAGEVVIRYAVIPTPKRLVVTVARVDGSWRIDDVLGELTFALP